MNNIGCQMFEIVIKYSPFIFLIGYLVSFYIGVLNSSMDTTRSTFWVSTIAALVGGKVIESVSEQFYNKQDTEFGFYLGMALQLIAICVLVYFWAQFCAGRARNAGREKKWAWIALVPVAGIIWLGVVQNNRKTI